MNNKQREALEAKLPEPPHCKYGNIPAQCTLSPMDCQCAIDAVVELNQETPPQPREWQELSEDELKSAVRHIYQNETVLEMAMELNQEEYKAISAALRAKNGFTS